MSTHEDFMRLAIALAENNVVTGNGGPFGAVVVKNDKVVASCANMVVPQNDPTAHAEISAIRLACSQLSTFNLAGCVILYQLRTLPHVSGCHLLGAY